MRPRARASALAASRARRLPGSSSLGRLAAASSQSPRPGCLRPSSAPARPLRPAARASRPATSRSIDHFDVVPHLAIELQVVRSSGTIAPSTRARAKPCFSRSSNRSRYSPFWPRISGASTRNRVPFGELMDPLDDLLARLGRDRPAALAGNAPGRRGQTARAGSRRSR